MKLILENVRCFAGRHEIPIKPLTILTGENSSGKTTFLAMLSAICSESGFPIQPRFNEPPYSLGSFDTISARINRTGHAKTFSVGYSLASNGEEGAREVTAGYRRQHGQIEVADIIVRSPIVEGYLRASETNKRYHVRLNLPGIETFSSSPNFGYGVESV